MNKLRTLPTLALGLCLASGALLTACDRSETASPAAPAQEISVAAATPVYSDGYTWFKVKQIDFDFPWIVKYHVTVPANATLLATTTHFGGQGNPALAAFYQNGKTRYATAYPVKVVGLNDDYSGKDARISWKNTTGAAKDVQIVGYAATVAGYTEGIINVRVTTGNVVHHSSSKRGYMTGVALHNNDPINPGSCVGPATSRITLKKLSAQGGGFNSAVLAVNATTLEGGFIRETDPIIGEPPFTSAYLNLGAVLPSGGAHLFLAFVEIYDHQPESTWFSAIQENRYTCP
jgi:hypothetical protein